MKKFYFHESAANYHKALARLEKNIRSGQFAKYSQQKKQEIWRRICRYAQQLGIKIKASVAAACIAAGLCLGSTASAQTFMQRTGAANPFNGVMALSAVPTFVDIDGDGDKDAFIGTRDGTNVYYKNTGTANNPVFSLQTGSANPLNGIDVGGYSSPTFVDIDGDGDMDVFIGGQAGIISYYKNIGSASAPVFSPQTGALNPLNTVNVVAYSAPVFVDIDNDGDKDVFIGSYYGDITYYKNTGTATSPVFTLQTGGSNPLSSVAVGYFSTPTFVDIDGDGDEDIFIGSYYGDMTYYKNTGSAASPVFTLQTGASNPFNSISIGSFTAPTFADIDGDTDFDAFIGVDGGVINYFENTSALPLHLLNFSGIKRVGYNQLQWQTADEVNTKSFEIERSTDGRNFVTVATVESKGSNNNNYTVQDNVVYSGKLFYRLKMVDIDGRFTYSQIIWINSIGESRVSLYPNPATDWININISSSPLLKTKAGIFDVNGRLMQNILINADQQQIDVHTFAKGTYLVKFADGSSQSFIKK